MTNAQTVNPAHLHRIADALDLHPELSVEDRAHLFACIGGIHGPVRRAHWEAVRRSRTCQRRTLRVAALFHCLDLAAGQTPSPTQILATLEKEGAL